MSGGRVPDHEYQPSAGISGPDQVREYDDFPDLPDGDGHDDPLCPHRDRSLFPHASAA